MEATLPAAQRASIGWCTNPNDLLSPGTLSATVTECFHVFCKDRKKKSKAKPHNRLECKVPGYVLLLQALPLRYARVSQRLPIAKSWPAWMRPYVLYHRWGCEQRLK